MAALSNLREGTLEFTAHPPERDPDPEASPWEGMSGAAVWVGDRIVGVLAKHHRRDGPGRLAAIPLDRALASLDPARQADLRALLGLPDPLHNVVPRSAGERVMTDYQAQVRDIAPDQLLDREAELDELVRFCAGDQQYAWWQAGPWAGKSALMSWFVLHPPAGVDVVSFFVTARLADQSDSHACTTALIEQLAALLGESPDTLLTARARRGTLLRLLGDAASRARETRRRLLLVIDGLDEDRSTGGSIAELLPRPPRLPPEVRVLVASRPHPPLPDDVLGDHPLKTVIPRQLDVSEHARDLEDRAKLELTRLLTGDQLDHDVLGLITAAGGGLTLGDLEYLAERPRYEIEPLLGGVFGRSVGSRPATSSAGHPDERVYLFAHETLRMIAEQEYGAGLATYRDRLHTWADTYRQRGWPADTPHYLLRSYPRMLASIKDLPRLIACATDPTRHNRIRDLTGGDALAFTEISNAQQLILKQPDPDLASLARLAAQREHLTSRNRDIPSELPAVWARIGQPTRAEGLVNSISERTDALCELLEAVAANGDHDRASRLADEAEAHIRQYNAPYPQLWALAPLIEVVATGGDHDRAIRLAEEAEMLIGQITDPDLRDRALARFVGAVAISGDHDRAESLAGRITNPSNRSEALTRLIRAAATGGDHDRAARLAEEAETLIGQIVSSSERQRALIQLVEAVSAGGNHDRAESLAGRIADPAGRAKVLAGIAMASGDHDRANRFFAEIEALADSRDEEWARTEKEISTGDQDNPLVEAAKALMVTPSERVGMLADAVVDAGNYGRAEALIGQITDPDERSEALDRLGEAVSAGGDHERAEALIRRIPDLDTQLRALARLAAAATVDGDHDSAARLADEVETRWGYTTDPAEQVQALARLVEAVAASGDHDRATWLADEADALLGQITDSRRRLSALIELVEVTTTSGDDERAAWFAGEAEALIRQITSRYEQPEELAKLVQAIATGGDRDRVARLVAEVEAHVEQITQLDRRAEVLAGLMGAAAAHGDHGWLVRLAGEVEALLGQITYPPEREEALDRLVKVVAAGGDHDRAEVLAGQITDPSARVKALTGLVRVTATSGDDERVARLADETETLIGQNPVPDSQVWALAQLVEVMTVGGDHRRAARLASEAEALIGQIPQPIRRAEAMARLSGAMAAGGDHDRYARLADAVKELVAQISDPLENLPYLLVQAMAAGGEHDRAEQLASQITYPGRRVQALAQLTKIVAAGGDHARVARLADKAETSIGQIDDPEPWVYAMPEFVEMVAACSDRDRAARLATRIEELIGQSTRSEYRVRALSSLVKVTAASGDDTRAARLADEAEALIGQITGVNFRAKAMTQIAAAVADSDSDRAARLITEAEVLIGQITGPGWQLEEMVGLVEAVVACGDHDRATRLVGDAEVLIRQMTYSDSRERALGQLVGVIAACGEHDRAEALASQMTNPYERVGALARLVEAVAAGGDPARAARLTSDAEALIGQITDSYGRTDPYGRMVTLCLQAKAMAGLMGAVAAGGDPDRAARLTADAEALIGQITDPRLGAEAMARLAEILVKTRKGTSAIPGAARSNSPLMVRARDLIAAALVTGSWTDVVVSLARADPLAAAALADEVQARWGLKAPSPPDNRTLTIRPEVVESGRAPQRVRGFLRWVRGGG